MAEIRTRTKGKPPWSKAFSFKDVLVDTPGKTLTIRFEAADGTEVAVQMTDDELTNMDQQLDGLCNGTYHRQD